MIRRFKEIHEFEKRISQEPDFQKKIKLYDEMYLCWRKLIAKKRIKIDPLENLDVIIKVAKVVNSI